MKIGLYDHVKSLYEYSDKPYKRIGTGLPSIDELTRGPAPGEIFMVLGRSYSGKSVFGQNIIRNNPTIPAIFFSMEMPANQALIRMYSMWTNEPASKIQDAVDESKLANDVWDMVLAYPQFAICEQTGISLEEMSLVVDTFEETNGCRPEYVVVDYLELLGGAKQSGEGYLATEQQATRLKDWAKQEEMRVFVLHQTNRQEPRWLPPTDSSARNAGFTEADFVVGMWRPHLNPELSYYDKLAMQDLVFMNVLKNRAYGKEAYELQFRMTESLRIEEKYE